MPIDPEWKPFLTGLTYGGPIFVAVCLVYVGSDRRFEAEWQEFFFAAAGTVLFSAAILWIVKFANRR